MSNRLNITIVTVLVLVTGALITEYVIETRPEKASSKIVPSKPAASNTSKAAPVVDPVASAETAEITEESEQETVMADLKGKDFQLKGTVMGNPDFANYQGVEVTMSDGTPIPEMIDLEGNVYQMENLVWSHIDTFELKNLILGDEREQIVLYGMSWIPRGIGGLDTYAVYRVEPKRLTELVSVITGRTSADVKPGEKPFNFKAIVTEKSENGQPVLEYEYGEEGEPKHILYFKWNGKFFEEPTGKYAKIREKYQP